MRTSHQLALAAVTFLVWSPLCRSVEEGPDAAALSKIKAATVFVRVALTEGESQGCGFFITKDLILTSARVLGMSARQRKAPDSVRATVYSGVRDKQFEVAGKVTGADISSDLAFVRIENAPAEKLPAPLELVSAREVQERMPVYIAGFPLGDVLAGVKRNPAVTIETGSVASMRPDERGILSTIQIDGDLNAGNGGGAIVDKKGRVVAVSKVSEKAAGSSIPAEYVRRDLDGRISQVGTRDLVRKGDSYSVSVYVTTLDPQSVISGVSYYYWTGVPGSARPADPARKIPLHGAPGDSLRTEVRLKYDEDAQRWTGEVKDFRVPPGKELWQQTGCIRKTGGSAVTTAAVNSTAMLAKAKAAGDIGERK